MPSRDTDRARPVDAEILHNDEGPTDDKPVTHNDSDTGSLRSFFHPWSGVLIIGVDFAAFGANAPSGFLMTPLIAVLAFLVTFTGVYNIQRNKGQDDRGPALWKAALGGIAAGIPFPIAGTFVGAAILVLSGLPASGGKGTTTSGIPFPPGKA